LDPRLAAWTLIIEGLKSKEKDVFYVAPTFQQAKDIMWTVLKELGHEVIKTVHENTAVITLVNDRKIYLKGSDRPDTMRGVGLAYVVIDEYADMKPQVFEQILRPALSDVKGGALFIGTPKGRNHFYELYQMAQREEDEDWVSFHFQRSQCLPSVLDRNTLLVSRPLRQTYLRTNGLSMLILMICLMTVVITSLLIWLALKM